MPILQQIHALSKDMEVTDLLQHLLFERFPNKVAVTASLRARSMVVLRLVADIAPSTPVIFCHAGKLYPESQEYRDMIVEKFGLTDVRAPGDDEGTPLPGDVDHVEWAFEQVAGGGRVKNAIQLNKSLAEFDCWVSAVYHMPIDAKIKHRVDKTGRLFRFNPLLRWGREQVSEFMSARDIPYHKMAALPAAAPSSKDPKEAVISYGY